jgi:hypothetical protein
LQDPGVQASVGGPAITVVVAVAVTDSVDVGVGAVVVVVGVIPRQEHAEP